jgi:hypothetical protein
VLQVLQSLQSCTPESSPKFSIGELLEGFEVLPTSLKDKDKNFLKNLEVENKEERVRKRVT